MVVNLSAVVDTWLDMAAEAIAGLCAKLDASRGVALDANPFLDPTTGKLRPAEGIGEVRPPGVASQDKAPCEAG